MAKTAEVASQMARPWRSSGWRSARSRPIRRSTSSSSRAAAPRPGTRPTAEALGAHLAAHLPPHALPARLHVLDQLPRTATGKVDRRALLARADAPVPEAATN